MATTSKKFLAVLASVQTAGFEFMGATQSAADAIKAAVTAGADPKAIKHKFVVGAVMRQLLRAGENRPMAGIAEQAEKVVADKADKRRAAALRAWSRASSAAGIRADKRGRKAGAKVGAKVAKGSGIKADKAKTIKANPAVASAAEASAHIRNMALMLASFCAKNKDVIPAETAKLVGDFVAAANKL
jgi:hypothetical protein